MLARRSDGTGAAPTSRNCGIRDLAAVCGRRIERPEVLQVGPAVERREPVEAEQADPIRIELAPRPLDLGRNALGEVVERAAGDRPLVRGAPERGAQLRDVEALASAAALSHPQ